MARVYRPGAQRGVSTFNVVTIRFITRFITRRSPPRRRATHRRRKKRFGEKSPKRASFSSNASLHHADVVEDLVDQIDKGDLITCSAACTPVQRKSARPI
ncbi:hypothetical protein [Paraburkholderia fynbosensis]|uniref:hypothetical protein n=1 Tax=Paraburkholderia fynbosensis TaxID=1200993 RepID=UPI0015829A20|nr:hypothetical protein [Paraburkholderia fynbosensis]